MCVWVGVYAQLLLREGGGFDPQPLVEWDASQGRDKERRV